MVGRLTGSVDGKPFTLDAAGDRLTITDASLLTLWRLRKAWPQVKQLLAPALTWSRLKLTVHGPVLVGRQELLPAPTRLARTILR